MGLSQEICRVLTKRRYNRGKPKLSDGLLQIIDTSINRNEPIKLVGFWGVGPKAMANWADRESCDFLDSLNREVKSIFSPGIEFTFIFADMHGIHNGYSKNVIDSYVEAMRDLFSRYSFKHLFLKDLWSKYDINFERIDLASKEKHEGWWFEIPQREIIEHNAANRNKKDPPKVAAQKYFIMRDLEKEMLQEEFKDYIFHAFSDPKLEIVLPDMPTLYFYGRESWSNAPWFVEQDKRDTI